MKLHTYKPSVFVYGFIFPLFFLCFLFLFPFVPPKDERVFRFCLCQTQQLIILLAIYVLFPYLIFISSSSLHALLLLQTNKHSEFTYFTCNRSLFHFIIRVFFVSLTFISSSSSPLFHKHHDYSEHESHFSTFCGNLGQRFLFLALFVTHL